MNERTMVIQEGDSESAQKIMKSGNFLNVAAVASGTLSRSPFTRRGSTWKARRVVDFERGIPRKPYVTDIYDSVT